MQDDRTRNVRVTLQVEIHLDDAGPDARTSGVNDATYDRASDLMHDVWCAGDPEDSLNTILSVDNIEWIGDRDG